MGQPNQQRNDKSADGGLAEGKKTVGKGDFKVLIPHGFEILVTE